MKQSENYSRHERWALLRFAVIGQLLAAPPPKGELRAQIEQLAARDWQHPITGLPVRFGVSTIERWYHRARKERQDPVRILRRKVRADVGAQESLNPVTSGPKTAVNERFQNRVVGYSPATG